MSYIGNQPSTTAFLTDTFNGTGAQLTFTMSVAPANTSSVLVAVSGVVQDPSTYSVAGTTLTFSAPPPSGTANISVRYLGIPASGVTNTAYRTITDFTATSGQTSFTVPSYTVGYIDVYRNGVRLAAADYTASTGTTVVLASGCTVGDIVTTESFYVSSVLNAIPATAGAVNDAYISDVSSSKLTGSRTIPKGTMPAGTVLQVVSTTKTNAFSTASTSFVDVTGLSASITPTSATSKILVFANFAYSTSLTTALGVFNLVRDTTNIAQPATSPVATGTAIAYGALADAVIPCSINFLDSPATTSATTYKIQCRTTGSTLYLNSRAAGDSAFTSTITIMEIAA